MPDIILNEGFGLDEITLVSTRPSVTFISFIQKNGKRRIKLSPFFQKGKKHWDSFLVGLIIFSKHGSQVFFFKIFNCYNNV